jgi:hypothetical protein
MPHTIVTDTLHKILEDAVEGVITSRLGKALRGPQTPVWMRPEQVEQRFGLTKRQLTYMRSRGNAEHTQRRTRLSYEASSTEDRANCFASEGTPSHEGNASGKKRSGRLPAGSGTPRTDFGIPSPGPDRPPFKELITLMLTAGIGLHHFDLAAVLIATVWFSLVLFSR